MPQTSVLSPLAVGSAGQVADEFTATNGDAFAGTNEESSLSLGFGLLVTRSSNEGVKAPTTLAAVKAASGVLIREDLFDITTQLSDITVNTVVQSGIKPGVTGSCLRRGRIWVIPEATGTEASAVKVRIVAGASTNVTLGAFTVTADAGKTVDISSLAKWIGTPTAATPSILEIDLTNLALATAD